MPVISNKPDEFHRSVRAAIVADPNLSNGVFSRRFGIRVETVRRTRRMLEAQGHIPTKYIPPGVQ